MNFGDLRSLFAFFVKISVALAVMGFGVYFGYWVVADFNSSVETTQGTIVDKEFVAVQDVDDEQNQEEPETDYDPVVTFEYSVDGQTYRGDRVHANPYRSEIISLEFNEGDDEPGSPEGREYEDMEDAREAVSQYERGETATIYYLPGDPSRSFLERPVPVWYLVGFSFAGAGIFFVGAFQELRKNGNSGE